MALITFTVFCSHIKFQNTSITPPKKTLYPLKAVNPHSSLSITPSNCQSVCCFWICLHKICWGPLHVVSDTIAPLSKALEEASKSPRKTGKANGRHDQQTLPTDTNTEGSCVQSDLKYTLCNLKPALPCWCKLEI